MRMKVRNTVIGALMAGTAIVGSMAAYANEPVANRIDQRMQEVRAKYGPQLDQLQRDGEELGDYRPGDVGAVIGVDVKIGSHREDIYVKIPEFWTGRQRIVVTLPEMMLGEKRWVYHTPSVRTKRVQVGVHPEWHGLFHMEWKPNYMDVPEPFMQEQVTILGIPEFKMGEQEIILDLPQIAFHEQRWSFDVPDITVIDVNLEIAKRKARAENLKAHGEAIAKEMKVEMDRVLLEELPGMRVKMIESFDRGEAQTREAIAAAKKYNVDTSKPFPDGTPALDEVLTSLQKNRAKALEDLDRQIEKLRQQSI